MRKKAPRTIRCIKTTSRYGTKSSYQPSASIERHKVHYDRRARARVTVVIFDVRKHRAPNGALRLNTPTPARRHAAPVRKHRAPNGALRRVRFTAGCLHQFGVRKHRAPNGALRRMAVPSGRSLSFPCQKAPSAKRCIKTGGLAVVFLVCF